MKCEVCGKTSSYDQDDEICGVCEEDINHWFEWLKVMGQPVQALDRLPALDLCPRHIRDYIVNEY